MQYKSYLSLLALSPLALAAPGCPQSTCKAYPGTPSWPSSREWHRLNETLDGRLIRPVAPGGVCHEGQPNFDEEECSAVKTDWSSYDWHAEDPVSVMWDNWANFTCLPDPEMPCGVAGYPAYVVNATTAEHVKAGVDFARENNIRLVVKSSGHDFLGRSVAPGSLSIWVHHLNDMTFHKDKFNLTGSKTVIKGQAVTCGGGTSMYDLYEATDEHGATVVGGMAKSVSVGGYLTGGGHSQLSPDYGLAADQVLEMEVVTPRGKILTVNEDRHPDLFWALRGGGGSTFGVITSVTLKAFPTPKVQSFILFAGTSAESPLAADFATFIAGQTPKLMDKGLRGYGWLAMNATNPNPGTPGMPDRWSGIAGAMTVLDERPESVQDILGPLNDTVQERFYGTAVVLALEVQSYGSWLEYFDVHFDNGTTGGGAHMVSRLLDEESLTRDPKALKEALAAATGSSGMIDFYLLAGKGVHDAKPRGGSNSVNPGWRKAYIHTLTARSIKPFDKAGEEEVKKQLDRAYEPLRKLTPGLGAYLNEAATFEKDPAGTFWGDDNYKRLLKIKRSVDPHDTFWCSPCVGNERWEERQDGRLCQRDG